MRDICIVAALLLGLGPAAALASGPGSSAGDNQYVDPLSGSGTTSTQSSAPAEPTTQTPSPAPAPATTSQPPSSAPASSAPASTSPSSGQATTSAAPTTQTTSDSGQTSSAPAQAASGTERSDATLPYTGIDVWLIAIVAAGAFGAGFALRRASRADW
jgi:cobalamin biosynthesis Mg chelatase CobN